MHVGEAMCLLLMTWSSRGVEAASDPEPRMRLIT